MRLDTLNRVVVRSDEHGLYDKLERHDSVEQRYEHKHVHCNRTLLQSGGKDEELAEESRKRRDTAKREHRKHHRERQFRICLVQSVIVADFHFPGSIFYGLYHTERRKVGEL